MASSEYATGYAELAAAKAALQRGRIAENSTKDDATRRDILRENSTRPATIELSYTAIGLGQQRVATPLIFPTAFRNEPHFTFGFAAASNPASKTWYDPIASVGVYAWRRNRRKLYTGAFIYYRVDAYPVNAQNQDLPPDFRTQLFLTFTGQGTKLSGEGALAEAVASLKAQLPGIK